MIILGAQIVLADFIPPIAYRIANKIYTRIHPPFNRIPRSVNVRWVLDIGANKGHVSAAALKTYPEARVICFEPVKSLFDGLSSSLGKYKGRVVLYNQALSDTNGEAEINLSTHSGANSFSPQSPFHKALNPGIKEIGKEKVNLVRLDDVAAGLPAAAIDVMKIDVEGHELNVLRGGEKFIKNNVDTILIEASFQRDSSWEKQSFIDVFDLLEDWGFRLVNVYDTPDSTNANNSGDLMAAQMDCVFRHKSRLKMPAVK